MGLQTYYAQTRVRYGTTDIHQADVAGTSSRHTTPKPQPGKPPHTVTHALPRTKRHTHTHAHTCTHATDVPTVLLLTDDLREQSPRCRHSTLLGAQPSSEALKRTSTTQRLPSSSAASQKHTPSTQSRAHNRNAVQDWAQARDLHYSCWLSPGRPVLRLPCGPTQTCTLTNQPTSTRT